MKFHCILRNAQPGLDRHSSSYHPNIESAIQFGEELLKKVDLVIFPNAFIVILEMQEVQVKLINPKKKEELKSANT